jgi:hypothetical protein
MIDESGLEAALQGHAFWHDYFGDMYRRRTNSVHLAVFIDPFLGFVLDGTKTVESRFSTKAVPPYRRVAEGDILLLKRSGGPVEGICRVADVWFYVLSPRTWAEIKNRFAEALCLGGSDFLDQRASASFATLMRLDCVLTLPPLPVAKRDRRGWVILQKPTSESNPDLFECLQR